MVKINMGCGPRNFGKDWIHIDGGDYPHLDYRDITKLEFEDESVDLIYASHVIEYFDRDEIIPILKEWRRVLKAGGILRLSVPDFEKLKFFHPNRILGPLYGKMRMGDKWIYHKIVYNGSSLVELLLECEFTKIRKWDWRQTEHSKFDDFSQAYIPHMDKENGILISLNMEAVK